jgi:uncharacterized membrane protein
VHTLRTAIGVVLFICAVILLAVLFLKFAFLAQTHNISYDVYISIMLTALGVMVATFAILVGLAAVWGYAGLKDYLHETASKQVDAAIQDTLKKYPASADMLEALRQLKEQIKLWDEIRNQAVTVAAPKTVEIASKPVIQEGVEATPLESIEKQATPIARLPGEEDSHGDSNRRTK